MNPYVLTFPMFTVPVSGLIQDNVPVSTSILKLYTERVYHLLFLTIYYLTCQPLGFTEELANKLFGAPEQPVSSIARSLPTTVPESPIVYPPRTPKTPRTPRLQDPTKTPRFYPVVKEGGNIDGKVHITPMDFTQLYYISINAY